MMPKNVERVLWFVAGAAVGAGVALLYAPQSGEETRKYLRKKAEEAKEKVVDAGEDLTDKGRTLYEKGAKVVEGAGELLERGRKWVTG
jgi:gas vesicle protein